jgi:hypothetical protein
MKKRCNPLPTVLSIFALIIALGVFADVVTGQGNVLDKTKDIVIDEPADKIEDVFDTREKPDDRPAQSYLHTDNDCRRSIRATFNTGQEPLAISMKELEKHPEDYYGKTVTVEGELHRDFTDNVFTIEDDGMWRDKDVLVISTEPKDQSVTPLKGEIKRGKDVTVTGVVHPYDRGKLECAYGPLNLESREGHSFTKNPVLIIDRTPPMPVRAAAPEIIYVPMPPAAAPPPPPPAPAPEPFVPTPEPERVLPKTAGESQVLVAIGLFALCAAFAMRRYRLN